MIINDTFFKLKKKRFNFCKSSTSNEEALSSFVQNQVVDFTTDSVLAEPTQIGQTLEWDGLTLGLNVSSTKSSNNSTDVTSREDERNSRENDNEIIVLNNLSQLHINTANSSSNRDPELTFEKEHNNSQEFNQSQELEAREKYYQLLYQTNNTTMNATRNIESTRVSLKFIKFSNLRFFSCLYIYIKKANTT